MGYDARELELPLVKQREQRPKQSSLSRHVCAYTLRSVSPGMPGTAGTSVHGGWSPLASHFFIDFPPVRPTRRQRIQVIVEYTNRYVQRNYVGFARDAGKVEEW